MISFMRKIGATRVDFSHWEGRKDLTFNHGALKVSNEQRESFLRLLEREGVTFLQMTLES